MDYRTGFRDGYNAARQDLIDAYGTEFVMGSRNFERPTTLAELGGMQANALPPAAPKKKRSSAYNRKYKTAFKKVSPKYKLKSGKWKKNGFKSAVKAAHKAVKK